MKTIEERAKEYGSKKGDISLSAVYNEALTNIYKEGYIAGASEQKAIDEKYIELLEEDRNAFIAFCYNIINGKYISVIDAAKEQLSYLENKVIEE